MNVVYPDIQQFIGGQWSAGTGDTFCAPWPAACTLRMNSSILVTCERSASIGVAERVLPGIRLRSISFRRR